MSPIGRTGSNLELGGSKRSEESDGGEERRRGLAWTRSCSGETTTTSMQSAGSPIQPRDNSSPPPLV